ncbi:efflux RND transporter periplasmic adaptor subunit [Kordiimonas sp. SCSIO 12610]|uniref:efflux RND transporter periplasmic adaptor subunit n=1 Tax=Kordiimonas sp. SCSIO 12610 TaxID=2829597 RepID=UPI0021089E22|nr:efflux RND transporter periplasmic adaptor subunit [Kordiimonas sp. SCSIO 12610]UTW55648.1 efflux RND transporter periplasmic adaptor subunit [Kordiimonas sp. SCSIO 12610]
MIEIKASSDIRKVSFPAIVEANESVNLTFEVNGELTKLEVLEGDIVKKGQIIAQLDQRNFFNNLRAAQAEFNTAELEFDRGELLVSRGALAQSIQDQRKARLDIARANLDIAQKAHEDTVLRSPFEGSIAAVHVVNFESITAQTPIITLQTMGAAEAKVQIPATLVANSGRIEILENTITLDAAPDQAIPTHISERARQADPRTQTFEMAFAFNPPEGLNILPGMTGHVDGVLRVVSETGGTERMEIPVHAILAKGGKTFVWVVNPETMTVSKREVITSTDFGETLRIESGLEAGEQIVGAGAAFLHDGMQVRRFEP